MKRRTVQRPEDIVERVNAEGFLPFFANDIAGFSLEEATPARLWFPEEGEGVWEWKGPVINAAGCAYGKFFWKKAGFVSAEWFPLFRRYRQSIFPLGETEELILDVLRGEESLLSKELRALCGFEPRGRCKGREKSSDDGPSFAVRRAGGFETAITRLQMGGWVVTADFEYSVTKSGRKYGWGVSRFCSAESFFGRGVLQTAMSPEKAGERVLQQLSAINPKADAKTLAGLLGQGKR